MEENLRNVCDATLLNEESYSNQKKLENNEISVNNICLSDKINLNESNKIELKITDKYCDINNSSNSIKKTFQNLADNVCDSVERSLHETLNKNSSNTDNEYHSESSETDLQIAEHKNNSKNRSLMRIIDSESEEDTYTNESNILPQTNHDTICTTIKSYRALIDSDTDKEEQNEETESERNTHTKESNNLPQTIHVISTTNESYRALIDSESEEEKQDEETENDTHIISKETFKSKDAKKKSLKKRKGSIRASKDEAMRQIYSESQRLLRETEISLPYHRPKQRTLQEFLNRRRISTALPKAPSTAAKLKMSSMIVSQVLAEKEKEAELFYKSSDSEDNSEQSVSLANKDIKKSSIKNGRDISSIDIDHTCIQERFETSARDSQDKKEIVQKTRLDFSECRILLQKDFCEEDHHVVESSSLTNNNRSDNEDDKLLRQITNEHNQNLSELSLPRKLIDIHFENELNGNAQINLNEQEATKEIVETIVTSLYKKKCINDDKKSKITVTENQISKIHQNDSEVINGRDKNLVTEATKISEILFNNVNNKEITETFQNDNDITDNVICSNSNECIIMQDRNNEKRDQYSKINDVSSTDEYEKIDGHVQGLPLPKFTDEDETSANKKKLLGLEFNSKVTLRGSPGMIIDLTDDTKSNIKGVNTLLDRFFCKHVNTKKQSDNKSEVTVVHLQNTQNGLFPVKETLPYKTPVNVDNSELNKPGAKLMRLKEDLKLQMTLKRNKEWKQKEIELQMEGEEEEEEWNMEEKSNYDLNEQEKAELDFESSNSEESEPEENDICIKDKKRRKCLFADDEAEVTDNEDSSTEETCNDSNKQSISSKYRKEYMDDDVSEIDQEEEEEEEEEEHDDDDDEENEGNEESLDANMENGNESDFKDVDNVNTRENFDITKNKNDRKTKQLIGELQDDSKVTNPNYLRNNSQLNIATDTGAFKTHCEDIDWTSENENNISICQQNVEIATRNQICKTPLTKTSMLDSVSPVTQLSVLNTTLDSNEKDSLQEKEYLVDKQFLSMENTHNDESSQHVCNVKNKSILKKKLFDDIGETVDDEYLMLLCSGKFESTQKTDLDLFSQSNTTELQLRSNKSENFNVKLDDVKQSKNSKDRMQDITLMLDEDSTNSVNHARKINEVNTTDSELKLKVISSDDEDEDTFLKPKKRSAKILNLSDSEEESSEFSDEVDIDNEEVEKQYIDYDSEENEMIVVPEKDIKKVAADFVEEEAELSESDWDSADEDEKDLDKLEFEEADEEHIDENEMKNQLERIHMKQILDEDKREVRLLKELLFEDGDLHTDGMGRERKFKWRNIDKLGNNIEIPQISDENDGWVDMQEDEEEAKWSKLRNERDKFLEERMKCLNNEIEDELCDSQIFKFGLEAVKKIKDNESQTKQDSLDKINSSENIEPIMPRNITDLLNRSNIGKKSQPIYNVIKKRSLLTRGEELLSRIASLAKQGDSSSHAINTRNFVFPHIDQNTNNTFKKETEIVVDLDSQIKPGKRKMKSNISTSKKRRK